MKSKRENFHNEIRKKERLNFFKLKRQQLMNSVKQQTELELATQFNYQNSYQFLQENANQLVFWLQQNNFQEVLERVQLSYHKLKQLFGHSKSAQRKNRVAEMWLAYKYDKILSETVISAQYRLQTTYNPLRKQICKYYILHFHLIFTQTTLQHINFHKQLTQESIFIALLELSGDTKLINKIFRLILNMIQTVQQFRGEFYFFNYSSLKINLENVFSVMYTNRQKMATQQFQQIQMTFIIIYRNYILDLESLKYYVQSKMKCKKQLGGIRFNQNKKYEEILEVLEYPDVVALIKNTVKNENKLFAEEVIEKTKSHLLTVWPEDLNNQIDLWQCVYTLRVIYDFFQQLHPIHIINQASTFLSLIPIKNINQQLKNQIIIYLDIFIYLDSTDILTKSLVEKHNLVDVLFSYRHPQIDNVRINIFSNLLLSEVSKRHVHKRLNQIVIYLYENENIDNMTILTFIMKYFHSRKFQTDSDVDGLVLQLLDKMKRLYYTEREVKMEVMIFEALYEGGYQGSLPDIYREWSIEGKFDRAVEGVMSYWRMMSEDVGMFLEE